MDSLTSQSSNGRSTKARQKRKSEVCIESPFEILSAADEQINPAILLAEELMLKGMAEAFDFTEIERAEEVLSSSREEISLIENQFTALFPTESYQEANRMLEETVLLDELLEANTSEILSEMIALWNTGKIPEAGKKRQTKGDKRKVKVDESYKSPDLAA